MHLKRIFTASLATLALPLSAFAGSLVIPAAGTGPGANGSVWKTEVTVANLSQNPVDVTFNFHDANGIEEQKLVTLAGHQTIAQDDIIHAFFGRTSATGAIELVTDDVAKIAATSRTYNESSSGRFGQDIGAVNAATLADNTELVLLGPADATEQRFNFGIYTDSAANVTWTLLRADGSTAATVQKAYGPGQQIQYNSGISSLFGAEAKNLDTVHAVFTHGAGIVYGSAIENASGDPSYAPGIPARREANITFIGVDRNEDGVVEYPDANHDGVTDNAIDIATSMFPSFFRVVAQSANGPVTYQILDNDPDVQLVDNNGTIEWAPGANRKGSTGTLRVRATAGGESTVLTIKVNFL